MFIDLTGQKFNMLLAVAPCCRYPKTAKSRINWVCRCECGNTLIARADKLLSGVPKSCGKREAGHSRKPKYPNGAPSQSRLYAIWRDMIKRCGSPKNKEYSNYGGRGIQVCSRWLTSFSSFQAWAQANGYQENLTLDRKNVNGNYTPENCRWATRKEQNRNSRSNRMLTSGGKTQCIAAWAEELRIPHSTIRTRLKRGLTDQEALNH